MNLTFDFITRKDPYNSISIHKNGCTEITHHGGRDTNDNIEYVGFISFESAYDFAKTKNSKPRICSKCIPNLEQ